MLPPSEAQDMLEVLADHVVVRRDQPGFDCRKVAEDLVPTHGYPPPLPLLATPS